MEELKYEKELLGKTEFLHERYKKKHLYISNFIEVMTKFQNACLSFAKSLNSISNKNYQLLNEKNNTIYNTIQNLLNFIVVQSGEYNKLYQSIRTSILEPTTKLLNELNHKEKDIYNIYKNSRNQYNYSKNIVEKAHKEYQNGIRNSEKAILNAKKIELNPSSSNPDKEKSSNKANNIINNTKKLEVYYFNTITEANKWRNNKYKKEKDLLSFYQNIDYNNYTKLKELIEVFLTLINKMYKSIFKSIEELSDKYKSIDISKDLYSFIQDNKNKNEKTTDVPISFKPYSPEASLQTTSITGDQKENEKLRVNYEVIVTLRKSFKNICEDLNMEEETKKHRLRLLSQKIFKESLDTNFTDEEKKELISYLEIPICRSYFLISLSKQRTRGRYKRGEKLINDLAEILNNILKISEKEKNYEDAKNCIILSQTFYTEVVLEQRKEKYKRYLFDYIVDNKWLKSLGFWEGIMEFLIQKEIKKAEKFNKDMISKETIEERKLRISNICFSQLLPLTNNMLEFYIEKRIIKKLFDLFVKKYEIDSKMAKAIYDNIDNTPELPPLIPLVRKMTKKYENKKRGKSLEFKKECNLNIGFEKIKKNTKKKESSVEKLKTKLILEKSINEEDTKIRVIKRLKTCNLDINSSLLDNSSESLNSSLYSLKSDIICANDSSDFSRKQSHELQNSSLSKKMEMNDLNINPHMISTKIPETKINLEDLNKNEINLNKNDINNNINEIKDNSNPTPNEINNNDNKNNIQNNIININNDNNNIIQNKDNINVNKINEDINDIINNNKVSNSINNNHNIIEENKNDNENKNEKQ